MHIPHLLSKTLKGTDGYGANWHVYGYYDYAKEFSLRRPKDHEEDVGGVLGEMLEDKPLFLVRLLSLISERGNIMISGEESCQWNRYGMYSRFAASRTTKSSV